MTAKKPKTTKDCPNKTPKKTEDGPNMAPKWFQNNFGETPKLASRVGEVRIFRIGYATTDSLSKRARSGSKTARNGPRRDKMGPTWP